MDLNRNYPYMFAHDSEGSSGAADACKDDYRGPEAFSEPETRAIADFVTKWSNLKVVINFHAFGNLFIYPFNYDTEANSELHDKYPLAAKFYNHLFEDGDIPKGSVQGNGQATIKYSANGEASDYMLAEKGVYALSPELGTDDKWSNQFILTTRQQIKTVLQSNFPWVLYTIKQLHPSINMTFDKIQ